jgi:sugar phosphate isomerase/epimerase
MKNLFLIFLMSIGLNSFSQEKDTNQKARLSQYIGSWLSADNLSDLNVSLNPKIKMNVVPKLDSNSLQVEVFERQEDKWISILVELISYDSITDQIVALGQNKLGQCFIGRGFFNNQSQWFMLDVNNKGETFQKVAFNFINSTEVIIEGLNPNNSVAWKIKYIKNNSRDKNIGIQLVSVRDAMTKNPVETIQQLGRMGYSFLETFVYSNREFYGMLPLEFKKLVEDNGMKFKGSMIFKSLPESKNWKETMNWWKICIQDHKEAGVEYITTSNNDIKRIKTKKELQKYCDYYNAIGKLCREKGIVFGFHNHTDEFNKIDGEVILDYWIKNTKPEFVSFQSDLYWMKVARVSPIDYFKKYPERFFSWHVKDEEELGKSGKTNFEEIYNYAKLAGLKYNIVEVEKYNYDPLNSVEMAYQYLFYSDFVKKYGD